MTDRAPGQAFSDLTEETAKLRRKATEVGFGRRLSGWLSSAGAQVKSTAELSVGMSRNDLNDCLQGVKNFKAACMELLPPAVEILYLRERAAAHGMDLQAVATSDATFSEVLMHVGAAITACGQSEADGVVTVDEAARDIPILRSLIEQLSRVLAHRERALAERGLTLIVGAKR